MKIKIEMDMPRWLSKAFLVGVPVAIVAIGAWVFAEVPNTFKAGDTVSAQKMMDNFAAVATPPGTVAAFAGTNVPSGWLLCDGSAVSRTQYSGLFAAISVTYGIGDAVNTFNLPDLRAAGVRGVGASTKFKNNSTVDLAQVIDDRMQGHRHYSIDLYLDGSALSGNHGLCGQFGDCYAYVGYVGGNTPAVTGGPISDGGSTPRTGPETTGKAIGMNYIIRY